jgi:sec-independent protein translocase protein TatC
MPIGPARMPFFDHIAELRKRLTIVAAVLVVATVLLYFFTDQIFNFLMAPVEGVIAGGKPIAIDVLGPMTMRFGLALWSAVVICSPIIAWQTLAFFLPAMRPKERKWLLPTLAAMVLLFVGGAVFCYLVILGPSFKWLAGQAGTIVRFTPTGGDMVTVVEFFLLGFGIAFQTPVVVFYLVYFGVIPYKVLRENWRFVYVAIVVISALITPDWSPVSMLALSGAMVVLYEVSLALVRVVLAKRIKRREAEVDALLEEE